MKYYQYLVQFIKGYELVYAMCEQEAVILAQAERIKKGLSYEILSCIELQDSEIYQNN